MSLYKTSRRSFLLSGASALALPFLESMPFTKIASSIATANTAAAGAIPTRLIWCSVGYGFVEEQFYPRMTGPWDKMTEGMAALDRHKQDISMISNLTNTHARDAHSGSTSYLTSANVMGTPGKRFHNSISCDMIASGALGKETRYSSIVLSGTESVKNGGHGPGLSLAWNRQGKPVSGIRGPLALYEKLFGDSDESPEERIARLKKKNSILDIVMTDAKSIDNKLGTTDKEKLDEYFQSIREIELGLIKEAEWASMPKPKVEVEIPDELLLGEDEIKLSYRLIALALQTQQTHVVSYRQPAASLIRSMSLQFDPHALSHYKGSPARTVASHERDKKCTELLAYFIDILKSTKEIDGSSLFDHCILSWGTNIRTGHTIQNLPALITGRGGRNGFKLGEHIKLSKEDTPLSNLWLTLLQQANVPVESFANSTGTINELLKT